MVYFQYSHFLQKLHESPTLYGVFAYFHIYNDVNDIEVNRMYTSTTCLQSMKHYQPSTEKTFRANPNSGLPRFSPTEPKPDIRLNMARSAANYKPQAPIIRRARMSARKTKQPLYNNVATKFGKNGPTRKKRSGTPRRKGTPKSPRCSPCWRTSMIPTKIQKSCIHALSNRNSTDYAV